MKNWRKLLIEKAESMEKNAIKLTMNLKKSFQHTGKLQAQDVARIDELYKQADSLKMLSIWEPPAENKKDV